MAIEDTFGYRFVRISLVLLNCLVIVRLISLLLQYSHVFEPTFVLFVLFIGSNFMVAIVGAIREHRISVLITGSITLIMFLSLLFSTKENKNINVSLFTLLAIAAQSLIFSEMLKERQALLSQRHNLDYIGNINRNRGSNSTNGHLAAVVVYQTPAGARGQPGGIFMVDPIIGSELAKDPPPSYFASSLAPPKYEDAIKLNSCDQSLPIVPSVVEEESNLENPSNSEPRNEASTVTSSTPTPPNLGN